MKLFEFINEIELLSHCYEINLYAIVLGMEIKLILSCENKSKLSCDNSMTQIDALNGML